MAGPFIPFVLETRTWKHTEHSKRHQPKICHLAVQDVYSDGTLYTGGKTMLTYQV